MPAHGSFFSRTINVVYSVDEQDANLFTKCGSPSFRARVFCTINSGVRLYSLNTNGRAFLIPEFPFGTVITVVVNGKIHGMGGDGGTGGDVPNGGGALGRHGGTAIEIHQNVTIDNTNGEIFAGGAGGGGGDAGSVANGPGGGGGQGAGTAHGGFHGSGGLTNSGAGTNGDESGPGNRGARAGDAGNAGDGKPWGGFGSGTQAQAHAVDLNGFTVTWLGGNNPSQVKGAVS